MRGTLAIFLLVIANIFMMFAWYGHLKLKEYPWFAQLGLPAVILFSWGIALAEYCFQVPANRTGFADNGGPFNLWQLKVLQEVITLGVFAAFTLLLFQRETFRWNYAVSFVFLVLAVYFVFKK